jgi:glycolate oxidase
MVMVVEPGVRTSEVQEAATAKGYLYAGEPSSGDSSFIGGNVATNAGGIKAAKYGTTRQQVLGFELVTPEGEVVMQGGKLRKDATGYSLAQLVIGSEGTLGVVTKIILRLIPKPAKVMVCWAVFPNAAEEKSPSGEICMPASRDVCGVYVDNKCILCCVEFLREKLPHIENGHYIIVSVEGDSDETLETSA